MKAAAHFLYQTAEAFEKLQEHMRGCKECPICFCSQGRVLFMDVEKKNKEALAYARGDRPK